MPQGRRVGFVTGLIVGLLVGASAGLLASDVEPRLIGGNGYLMGWDVSTSDGDVICGDPYIWASTREIECD